MKMREVVVTSMFLMVLVIILVLQKAILMIALFLEDLLKLAMMNQIVLLIPSLKCV